MSGFRSNKEVDNKPLFAFSSVWDILTNFDYCSIVKDNIRSSQVNDDLVYSRVGWVNRCESIIFGFIVGDDLESFKFVGFIGVHDLLFRIVNMLFNILSRITNFLVIFFVVCRNSLNVIVDLTWKNITYL